MSSLFGVELPTPVNFVIAFVVVLALIGAVAWLLRRFGTGRLDASARSRQPRLAVIDAASVEGFFKALKYNARRYPAIIVNGKTRFLGSEMLSAASEEIARQVASQPTGA